MSNCCCSQRRAEDLRRGILILIAVCLALDLDVWYWLGRLELGLQKNSRPAMSTRQSLASLLPTNHPIPAKLLSTTDLLVTLSRQRLPNLKPDEEIARTHACAELACNRLRVALRLPNLKSGTAPCRPAVYKKLLAFLSEKLGDVDVTGTPKKGKKRPSTALQETPTKKRRMETKRLETGFAGKVQTTQSDDRVELEFMLKHVKALCRNFDVPECVPHVYIGVGVMSGLLGAKREEGEEMMTVLNAVFLLTVTRMKVGRMTMPIYVKLGQGAVQIVGGHEQATEDLIERINNEGLTEEGAGSEWYYEVPSGVIEIARFEEVDREDVEDQEDEEVNIGLEERLAELDPEGVILQGLGTMMNDEVDYLSEERFREYDRWEKEILQRMEEMERSARTPKKGKGAVAAKGR